LNKRNLIVFITAISSCALASPEINTSHLNLEREIQEAAVVYNNAKFSQAIKSYKKMADSSIEGYLNLAVIFKDLGHYDQAIKILNKAQALFDGEPRVLLLIGRLYYLNHQTDEAIAILKHILEIKPDDLDTHINLGLCYEDKGDDAEAQKYLEKVTSLDKNNVIARISLANLYYRKERLQEAANEYKAVSLIDASILSIQKLLGEISFRIGNLDESLKVYRKIRLVDPTDKLAAQRIDEISARLGKEYFEKERERQALQRKQKIVLVKPSPFVKKITFVRVGLINKENSFEFKCSTPFEAKTKSGQISVLSGLEGQNYSISRNPDGKIVISNQNKENVIVDEPILIKPLKPQGTITLLNVKFGKGNFWAGSSDRSYRGVIEINASQEGINAVNIVNLEEYLYSVLPSEMPANWPKEALKAQAVAARSEAINKLGRHKNEGFDFCSEVHCQVYTGVEQETEATTKAVDETRGLIMVYKGSPIDAIYSSNCGGHTQDNIFGKDQDISYLKGRLDTLENKSLNMPLSPLELEYWLKQPPKGILCDNSEYSKNSSFRWVRIYSAEEINEMLNKISDFGEIKKIIVFRRNSSGHVSALKITGTNSTSVLEKELSIRNALGNLRSSMFKLETKYSPNGKPQQFIFYGGGFGHGVGMCQSGAYGLANLGKDYKEILSYYYQGIEFKKRY